MLKSIDIHILKILMANKKITLKEILNIYEEKEANVRASLARLEDFFVKYKLGKINKDNKEFSIEIDLNINEKTFYNKAIVFSSEERLNYMMLVLVLLKQVNTTEIAEYFQLNRNTIVSDINELKQFLSRFNLTLESVPWKGLYLNGNSSEIYNFSISVILKYLVEKDLNALVFKLYKFLVNPAIDNFFQLVLPISIENDLKEIAKSIINHFKILTDVYGYNALTAVFIYLYLTPIITEDEKKEFLNIKNPDIKKSYDRVLRELKNNNFFEKKEYLKNNEDLIALSILNITKEYLMEKVKNGKNSILDDIEESFDIKLTPMEKMEFLNILNTLEYKEKFKIYNFVKIPKNRLKIPEVLVKSLSGVLEKHSYKILKKDIYIVAHFIYEIIYIDKMKKLRKKPILIIDYSSNNWRGEHLKNRLETAFDMKEIVVKSLYSEELTKSYLNHFSHILISSDTDMVNVLKRVECVKKKVLFLEYLDFFEISFLMNKMMIRETIKK